MNYITFKKMFDYVDRIEKARSHKYIDRRPKKTGKGWYYIYAETFKKPFRALLEIFDIKKERIDKDYEEDNIQKDFGVDKNLYASHVLEFFLNREKWHNIFSKKENRQKYTQAVKQSDVEKKAKEKKEKSTEKKKTTTETTKTQKLNRSLMFRIWKRNTPEAEKLLEQDKENINDEDKQQLEDLKHRAWANRAGSYEYTDRNGNIIRGETGLSGGMMKGKYSDEVAELAKMSKEELEAEKKRLEGIVSDSYYFSTRQAASRVGSHVKAMAEAETKLNKVKQVLRRFRKKTRDKQPAGKEGVTKESGNERTYNKKKFSDLTDEEKQQKKKQIRSNIVSKVKIGIIHKTEDKRASDVAYEWVDENIKGDIFTVIGNVKFNRKTVKEDLSHGFGQEKLDTLTAVKDVLEKGTYLGYERNFQGETNENHYFAGKIKYGNDEKIVFCRVKDSAGGNSCFYVHEVFTEDEIKSDLPRLGVRETDSSRLVGKPLYKFILQTIFNVNDDNIIRKAIFLSKLNHEFCKLVEREKRKEAYLDKLGRGYIAYLKKHYPELV